MSNATSVIIDPEIKREASKLAKTIGLNLSSVINAQLYQFVTTRKLELYVVEEMSPELEAELAMMKADIATGKNVSKSYSDINELFADLDS
jgi:addiction module RelB/DinJ family antitoxin